MEDQIHADFMLSCPSLYRDGGWMYHSNLITHDTTTDAFALYMLARCWDLNDDTRAFFAKTEPHFKTAVRLGRRLMLEYPELVRDVVKVKALAEVAYQLGVMRFMRMGTPECSMMVASCTHWEEVAALFRECCDFYYRRMNDCTRRVPENIVYYDLVHHNNVLNRSTATERGVQVVSQRNPTRGVPILSYWCIKLIDTPQEEEDEEVDFEYYERRYGASRDQAGSDSEPEDDPYYYSWITVETPDCTFSLNVPPRQEPDPEMVIQSLVYLSSADNSPVPHVDEAERRRRRRRRHERMARREREEEARNVRLIRDEQRKQRRDRRRTEALKKLYKIKDCSVVLTRL
ncbi:hypothetical protein [Crucian carp herpesvirus]|uniref:ORF151 n=1 Tax=Cyprinid herpesvirus 2 TaxID=317878 RepID=A0A0E3T4U3_CYHV2|nr:hypothetical protein [Cyprinid herpesvirus 2]AMB21718.1 ORF151 [Cyprinid herpesvirus 2]APD51593.1 hypothetical protein [Crucian carp herpesvirus]QAU54870.1 protein ORF151 [Cyprinid herpesvirus 2]QIM55325.1 hypothetical protein [Cyprinid herpesvirus 2]